MLINFDCRSERRRTNTPKREVRLLTSQPATWKQQPSATDHTPDCCLFQCCYQDLFRSRDQDRYLGQWVFRSRDQDRDLGLQVSRPRPRPWTSGLETKTELGLQVSRPRPGQNELKCTWVSRPWSPDHNTGLFRLQLCSLTVALNCLTVMYNSISIHHKVSEVEDPSPGAQKYPGSDLPVS